MVRAWLNLICVPSAKDSLSYRKEQLRQRRGRLSEARSLHEKDILTEFDAGSQLAEHKYTLLTSTTYQWN